MVEERDRELWQAVERDYLSGEMTVRAIAKKHNVSESRIYKKATSDGWKKKKEKIKKKADEIVITRNARARAREMETMCSAAARMSRVLDRTLEAIESMPPEDALADLRGLSDVAKAIRSNTDALMLLHGIQTPGQVEAQKIARKRLQLEEQKDRREAEKAAREAEEAETGQEIAVEIVQRKPEEKALELVEDAEK